MLFVFYIVVRLLLIVAEAESADFFRLIDIGERVGINVFYDLFEQGGLLFLHDADQDFSGGICVDAFRVDYRTAAVQDLHDCVADFFRLISDDIKHDAGLCTRRDDVRNLACQKQGDERVKYRGCDFDESRVRVHAFCRQQTDDTRQQNDDAVKQENKPTCIKFGLFLFAIFPRISVPPALLFVRREPPSATPEMTPPAIAEIIVRLLSMPEP